MEIKEIIAATLIGFSLFIGWALIWAYLNIERGWPMGICMWVAFGFPPIVIGLFLLLL